MKIRSVKANNRRKAFEVRMHSRTLSFPYIKAEPRPAANDPVDEVSVDKELGREAFVYVLKSGAEGTIHIDQVLEYNQDPGYLRDLLRRPRCLSLVRPSQVIPTVIWMRFSSLDNRYLVR